MNASLTCPKCGAPMRAYERNRVHVDQCTGCGGLFLDRGELEALVAAENAWHTPQPSPSQPRVQDYPGAPPAPAAQPYAAQPGYPPQPGYQQPGYAPQPGYQQPPVQPYGAAPYRAHSKAPRHKYSKEYGYGYGHRRKRSFLSELFDD